MHMQMRRWWFWGLIGWLLGAAGVIQAAEYRLRLAHIEEHLFFRYLDTQGHLFQAEQHILPQLSHEFDTAQFPAYLLIPDRHPQALNKASGTAAAPQELAITNPSDADPWTHLQWSGTPGQHVIFRISGYKVHYQELTALAVQIDGVLRRLPIHRVPLFGSPKLLVPSISSTYMDYTLERGTFATVVAKHATSFGGLSIIVGPNDDPRYPDSVYLHVRMPAEPKQMTIVFAWKDRDELRQDGDNHGADRD